jgi:hypothetical protein
MRKVRNVLKGWVMRLVVWLFADAVAEAVRAADARAWERAKAGRPGATYDATGLDEK